MIIMYYMINKEQESIYISWAPEFMGGSLLLTKKIIHLYLQIQIMGIDQLTECGQVI